MDFFRQFNEVFRFVFTYLQKNCVASKKKKEYMVKKISCVVKHIDCFWYLEY
jgi:hypothetical protein